LNDLYDSTIGNTTHLGKFVSVGSTELSNRMASYMTDQKVFRIETFYSFGGSCVAVLRQCRRVLCSCCTMKRDYLCAGLVNGLKTQEVVMNV
jgi:hypothetical protein